MLDSSILICLIEACSPAVSSICCEHPHSSTALNNRAMDVENMFARLMASIALLFRDCITRQGKFEEAELLFKRAKGIREAALGAEHPVVAAGLGHIAGLFYEQVRAV